MYLGDPFTITRLTESQDKLRTNKQQFVCKHNIHISQPLQKEHLYRQTVKNAHVFLDFAIILQKGIFDYS
ncbi:hypothetical protein DXT76_18090 [Halobacillus trueperi]|uniref:Uncharacterized protein n=1 Tax=Halobacillus trueperi TaxID=156205 RepID=A0A3D8VGE7_9BACI|nr:hypothetical protein DXT76_18090 [Halobacillus trueperi]